MRIVRKTIDSAFIVLEITGEVKLGEPAESLSAELASILSDAAVEGVVLNLENINYLDRIEASSALRLSAGSPKIGRAHV